MNRVLPILFNTDMVRAILDGKKTVTRRVIKAKKYIGVLKSPARKVHPEISDKYFIERLVKAPYEVGDILYVRETWAFISCIGCNGDYARPGVGMNCYDVQAVEYDDGDCIADGCFVYRADCKTPERITWHPSIHMPKEAARIWLKVTDVRVEKLQEITEEQAIQEGIAAVIYDVPTGREESAALEWFPVLWNSTIKKPDIDKYGWKANPFVWVIEFERCEKPGEEQEVEKR